SARRTWRRRGSLLRNGFSYGLAYRRGRNLLRRRGFSFRNGPGLLNDNVWRLRAQFLSIRYGSSLRRRLLAEESWSGNDCKQRDSKGDGADDVAMSHGSFFFGFFLGGDSFHRSGLNRSFWCRSSLNRGSRDGSRANWSRDPCLGNRGPRKMVGDIGRRPAAFRLSAEAVTHDVLKSLRQRLGQRWFLALGRVPRGRLLREDFDERHAQRPHIPCGGRAVACSFGRIVNARRTLRIDRIGEAANAVTRKFQLFAHRQDVRRLDVAVNEPAAVHVGERVENGREHVARFVGCKRALRNDLREVFVGKLHHDVEHRGVFHFAAAQIEDADQMRMREVRGQAPAGKLKFRVSGTHRDKLDRCLLRAQRAVFGKKNSPAVGAAQVLAKMIFPVDNFALEKALGLRGHCFPLPQDRLRARIRRTSYRTLLPGLGVTLASGALRDSGLPRKKPRHYIRPIARQKQRVACPKGHCPREGAWGEGRGDRRESYLETQRVILWQQRVKVGDCAPPRRYT